jgi:hypothetical protein
MSSGPGRLQRAEIQSVIATAISAGLCIAIGKGPGLGLAALTHWVSWWRYPEMRCITVFEANENATREDQK